MSNFYMVLIDGTGPYDDQQYERDFSQSFLSQIASQLGSDRCGYFAGPGTLGLTTRMRSNGALAEIVKRWSRDKSLKIFLGGYSRGGAAAIECTKMLGGWFAGGYGVATVKNGELVPEAVPIEALFLLDPVSKDVLCTGGGIKPNVRKMYSVLRDQSIWEYSPKIKLSDFVSPLDKALAAGFNFTGQNDPDRYARKFMSNADMSLAAGNGTTKVFEAGVVKGASHGAIGGLPWVERREDEAAAKSTAKIINNWLKANGINVAVEDNSYTEQNKRKFPQVTETSARAAEAREREEWKRRNTAVTNAEAMRDRLRPTAGARER